MEIRAHSAWISRNQHHFAQSGKKIGDRKIGTNSILFNDFHRCHMWQVNCNYHFSCDFVNFDNWHISRSALSSPIQFEALTWIFTITCNIESGGLVCRENFSSFFFCFHTHIQSHFEWRASSIFHVAESYPIARELKNSFFSSPTLNSLSVGCRVLRLSDRCCDSLLIFGGHYSTFLRWKRRNRERIRCNSQKSSSLRSVKCVKHRTERKSLCLQTLHFSLQVLNESEIFNSVNFQGWQTRKMDSIPCDPRRWASGKASNSSSTTTRRANFSAEQEAAGVSFDIIDKWRKNESISSTANPYGVLRNVKKKKHGRSLLHIKSVLLQQLNNSTKTSTSKKIIDWQFFSFFAPVFLAFTRDIHFGAALIRTLIWQNLARAGVEAFHSLWKIECKGRTLEEASTRETWKFMKKMWKIDAMSLEIGVLQCSKQKFFFFSLFSPSTIGKMYMRI